ncbi:MAG: phosphodiester glycosidase family protein [bacterium]
MKKWLTIIIFISSVCFGQTITWTDVSAFYNLPEGVKLFSGERTSPILKAYYYDVDLNNPKLAIRPYATTSPSTVNVLNARFGAYASVNGGFFGGTTSYSAVIYPNEVKAQNIASVTRNNQTYPLIRSFFGMKTNKELSIDWIYHFNNTIAGIYTYAAPLNYIYNDPTPLAAPLQTNGTQYQDLLVGIGGGPTLVKNGQVNVTYNQEVMWGSGVGLDNRDPRTALGYTGNKHVIILVADGRQTISEGLGLTELAQEFINLGCVEAMNLDGGGSTQMALGNQFINSPSEQRAVPVIFSITHIDSLHLPKEPTFEKVIDTGDPEASLNGPDWFPTANTGFWGTTPAQLNAVGVGDSYAQFNLNLSKEALYDVYGWWVSSANRCKTTPFFIKHKNGTDTVKVDQTLNGSSWKLIGTYTFDGLTDETVKISDAGTGSAVYVVADAIRLVSYDSVFVAVKNEDLKQLFFDLEQNYPNPFNPSTIINYSIMESGLVNISVYNTLGQKVSEILNKTQNPGNYSVNFDAQNLSSGVYFYTLKTNNFTQTKKMILVR